VTSDLEQQAIAAGGEAQFRAVGGAMRVLARAALIALPTVGVLHALHVPSYLGWAVWTEQVSFLILGLTLLGTYLTVPARRLPRGVPAGAPPWIDVLFGVAGLALCVVTGWNYETLISSGYGGFAAGEWSKVLAGVATLLLVLEATRRLTGWPLVILVAGFTAYATVAGLMPGILTGRSVKLDFLFIYLHVDTAGIIGAPIAVVIQTVLAYILFGSVLFGLGGGAMFTDLALAVMGRYRGGSAKAAVVASSLFGTVSGSAVANVVTTGIVTIPMMKRGGFKPHQAGAVEAVASTGGQLMPPIMGAAAFIMADYLNLRYAEVALAALIPALLYYTALFIQIDFAARKAGLMPLSRDERPSLVGTLARYWQFLLPLFVLIYVLFFTGQPPEIAAILATVATFAAAAVKAESRAKLARTVDLFADTGKSLLDLVVITASAGMIIGILSTTGLGFSIGLAILKMSGEGVVILLLLAALMALVLGMGMPTTAVYILMASLIAPALVKAGIAEVNAHLFVLYYGVLSMITPPVCFASFAAASIAGAGYMRTGLEAMKLGFVVFLVPFLFVFSPELVLQSDDTVATVRAIATGLAGCVFIAAAFEGYLIGRLGVLARAVSAVAGVSLMIPDSGAWAGLFAGRTDLFGLVVAAALVAWLLVRRRRAAA